MTDREIARNLEAVRTGAMVKDPGTDALLLRLKFIRVNRRTGWYDLTQAGRFWLARWPYSLG